MTEEYDFCGYVTRNDIKCSDGRTIRSGAFKENDGTIVPLVWQHNHNDPTNVLGHALLENREDGVYGYCSFNGTDNAEYARELVRHGDITSMSIFANRLTQKNGNVTHGVIREVSLVYAGANPGAYIENVNMSHSDMEDWENDGEAIIHSDSPISIHEFISHKEDPKDDSETEDTKDSEEDDSNGESPEEIYETFTEEEKEVTDFLVGQILNGESGEEDEEDEDDDVEHSDGPTIGDIIDGMSNKKRACLAYLIDMAEEQVKEDSIEQSDEMEEETLEHEDSLEEEGNETMKHNVFDNTNPAEDSDVLSHDELSAIFSEAKSRGSLREAFLEHGVTNLEILFPEAKLVTPTPDLISRPMAWVSEVWNALKKTPFSRIKSTAADVTADEARARGYVKGKKKIEEVLSLLKRTTSPQTVYKLQKMDRDDIIDITDLDIVAWLKTEMRMMLNEELARAVMVGDGRSAVDESKIKEEHIRPIFKDDDLYTIHYSVDLQGITDVTERSNKLVEAAIRSRKDYRGSGSPSFYCPNDVLTDMMLAVDKIGRRLYNTEAELAAALRVSKIVEIPVMEGVTRTDENNKEFGLIGLIVNLGDYTVGADRGGEVAFFDDFDINYNKYEYLIETRCSGSLTKPFSAISLEQPKTTSTTTPTNPTNPVG